MIAWLASYPRSGSSFMGRALNAAGFDMLSLYNDGMIDETTVNRKVEAVDFPIFDNDDTTYFCKTHGIQSDNRASVYLVRDGRDALVSYAHYAIDFQGETLSFEDMLIRLIIGDNYQYPNWSFHVMAYLAREKRTLVIRYEDMVENITAQVQRVSQFLGLAIPENVQVDFDKLHADNPKFYRRGIAGNWRNEMSEELQRLFWNNHSKAMQMAGYRE